jgi:hypothetical protein
MEVVNFDYLVNAERVLTYADVNLQEDYILLGKYDPRRRDFKLTDYPPFAIPASEVFGYNEVRDENIPLPHRQILDFQGLGVTVTDDLINKKTIVTIPGGGVTPGPVVITLSALTVNYIITTNARYTIVNFDAPLNSDHTFDTVLTGAQLGDKLLIMTTCDVLALSVNLTFSASKYYIWACAASVNAVDLTGIERNVLHFVFDGTKWVSTYDNC